MPGRDLVAPNSGKVSHRMILAVMTAAVGAYALLQSLVIPVLPTIQRNLHTSQDTVTWVLTAYLLAASIFTPILGRVGDMYGKERMFVVALSALAVGSLLAGLADSVGVMIVARAIQGVGGGVLPLAFGIIRDEFPPEKVPGVVGIIAALTAAGGGLGIVLAGPIVDLLGYHWLFWLPLIIVTGAAIAAHLCIPESPVRTQGRISWGAALLLSGWLVALLIAVSEAPSWGWTSTKVLGLIGAGIVLALAWIVVETRSDRPLIDMRMMKLPVVWTSNLVALLIGVGIYAIFAFIPEFLQTAPSAGYGFGASITESGLIMLPMTVTMFVLGISSGRLANRFGSKVVLIAGTVASVIPFIILVFAHSQKWEIALAMAILGAGFGMAFAAMSTLVVAGVPAEQTGVASGMNANIRTIGGAIGAAAMASIVTSAGTHNGLPHLSGYIHGFVMLGIATMAAVVAGLLIPSVRPNQAAPHTPQSDMLHAELAIVAGGTLVGDESE
jgi:EmrB/QacA subfamily drug resistance transporter